MMVILMVEESGGAACCGGQDADGETGEGEETGDEFDCGW